MKTRTGIALVLFVGALGGFLLSQSAFFKGPKWTIQEWHRGDRPVFMPAGLIQEQRAETLDNKKIRWSVQAVAGIPIEDSFFKTVEQDGVVIFSQGRFLASSLLPREADVRKELNQIELLKARRRMEAASSECRPPARMSSVLRHRYGRWQIVYKNECETQGGVVELAFNRKGGLIGRREIAAQFDWESSQVVLYPRGPALSRLTAMNLPVSAQPFYLLTPEIEVRSDAGLQFADLQALGSIRPEDPRFDMVQAYLYSTEALRWAGTKLNTKVEGLKLRTHVGYPENRSVAFYYNKEVRIGRGDDLTFTHMAWDPTIVVHETMHSVVEALTHMPFQGEGGSLSEGLADSLTALQLQTPKMGEGSFLTGPYQRTLTDEIKFSEKSGKLYHDSLIFSGTVWQVREDAGEDAALDLVKYVLQNSGPITNFDGVRRQVQDWFQACSLGERCDRIGRSLNRRGWL